MEKVPQNTIPEKKALSEGEKKWLEYLKSSAGKTETKQQIESAAIDYDRNLSNEEKTKIKIQALKKNMESHFNMSDVKQISIEPTGDEKIDTKNLLLNIGAIESLNSLEKGENPKKILSRVLEFADSIISNSANEDTKNYIFQGIEIKNAVQKLLDYYK